MALEIEFDVEGVEETFAALDKLPTFVRCEASRKALQAASMPVLSTLEPRIPVGATAALKAALQSKIITADDGSGFYLEIDFGDQNYIAHFLEYGHVMLSHSGKPLTGPKTPDSIVHGKPFIRTSLATSTPELVEAYYETLMTALAAESEIVTMDVPSLPVEL